MLYELLIILVVMLGISFTLNKKDIMSPSFIFCASFVFCSMWAVMYKDIWELGLRVRTLIVICGGVLEFIIVCSLIQVLYAMTKGNKYNTEKVNLQKIEIDTWKNIICLIFCICSILYTIFNVTRAVNGNIIQFPVAISKYRNLTLFYNKTIHLSRLVTFSRIITNSLVYWYIYVMINNFLIEKKVNIIQMFIVIFGALCNTTLGGRGGAVNMALSVVPITYLMLRKKNGYSLVRVLKLKTILIVCLVSMIFLMTFQQTARLLGRKTKYEPMYYLAIYCGAEIKNLDIFLQENEKIIRNKDDIWGSQTFFNMVKWIGPKLGNKNKNYNYQLDLPFRHINGLSLGNVYTTFYPYIYDFGYQGLIILVGIMAIISQIIYEKCKRVKIRENPSIFIILYGYIFSSLVLSFFSNKFYEQNVNTTFIYSLVLWNVYNLIITKHKKIYKKIESSNKEF